MWMHTSIVELFQILSQHEICIVGDMYHDVILVHSYMIAVVYHTLYDTRTYTVTTGGP